MSELRTLSAYAHRNRTEPVSERFGERALTLQNLLDRVSPSEASALRRLVDHDVPLPRELADGIALAVQRWAISHGATHYTHWFHPLTGLPAEKHDSFVSIEHGAGLDARPVEDFSGSKLVQGEPDASSFPSGGLRNTAEARGYTGWDPTSPMFIKDDGGVRTLCVPCTFTSWKGHALDTKVPLLRARAAIEKAALRLLNLIDGPVAKRVFVTLGPEQEYFLVDRALYNRRPDLSMAGRTLLGAVPQRGQQLEDHYFVGMPARVAAFVAEVEEELWRLGVPVKTRHNEVAPAQFETAPVFEEVNVACDHNALTMDVLRRVAAHHDLACLLHEKPFAGVNGSGKHNNWALSTDTGVNLLDPGDEPLKNVRFLLVLASTLLALHRHARVLRVTIASAGNDHRLGANEAPPSILSAYLGDSLEATVRAVVAGQDKAEVGGEKQPVRVVPGIHLRRDPGDRNRTSPFAFTGNKFEFRAVGASENCGWAQAVLNAAVADTMTEVSDRIEARLREGQSSERALREVAREVLTQTRAVCFEGNGYSDAWREEAALRGLPNLRNSAEALPVLREREATAFLVRQGVFSADEIESRAEVLVERYVKQLDIEARTLVELARIHVAPAVERQIAQSSTALSALSAIGAKHTALGERVARLGNALDDLLTGADALETLVGEIGDLHGDAALVRTSEALVPALARVRSAAEAAEAEVSDALWTLPRYRHLLFFGA